jgi:hypothetical protein
VIRVYDDAGKVIDTHEHIGGERSRFGFRAEQKRPPRMRAADEQFSPAVDQIPLN